MAHRNPANIICVRSDASDRFQFDATTQCHPTELENPKIEQNHESLAFLGSQFTAMPQRRTNFEQTAYSIFENFTRFKYILLFDQRIHNSIYHKCLFFTFHPHSVELPKLATKLWRLEDWNSFQARSIISSNIYMEIQSISLTFWRSEQKITDHPIAKIVLFVSRLHILVYLPYQTTRTSYGVIAIQLWMVNCRLKCHPTTPKMKVLSY